jgi:hypothetical protein
MHLAKRLARINCRQLGTAKQKDAQQPSASTKAEQPTLA